MSLVPAYRRRPSALHSARAGLASAFCCSLALAPVLYEHPLVVAGALTGTVAAGAAAGVGSELWRAARLAAPLALLVTLINPLLYQEGATVLVRGGELLGRRLDVTLEATAYGAVAGLRVTALVMAFALFSAAVDPDELLRLFRRVSYRSALTASLATRLVPVLARDATGRGEAARCRPVPPGRLALLSASLAGTLDRAVDVAAALEVRGYASARRPSRERRPWSRHDVSVLAAAALIAAVLVGGRAVGLGGFEPYPRLDLALGSGEIALTLAVVVLAGAPFAGRAARRGVARA